MKELKTLLLYVRRYGWRYAGGIVCLLVTDGGLLLVPQVLKSAVDIIAGGSFAMASIAVLVRNLVLLALLIGLGRFGWRLLIIGSAHLIERDLRHRLYSHLQTLSSSFYGRSKTGDLMARFTNDLQAVRMASSWALVGLLDGLFMTGAILVIMLARDATLTLITMSPLPVITIAIVALGRVIRDRFRRVQEGFASLSEWVQESLSGIRVVKTFVKERAFVRRFEQRNLEYIARSMDLVRLWGMIFPSVQFISGATIVIFLFLGGRSVVLDVLTPGDFSAFMAYLLMMRWPMLGAGFTINLMQRAAASMGRINAILAEEPDIASLTEPFRTWVRGEIEFHSLSYRYPESAEDVLHDINLRVPAGSTLGILGRTGSGKTTLVSLIPRLLDPPPATLLIDGRDVRDHDQQHLRAQIGMVPQDTFLFSSTIRENIAFGNAAMDEERIRQMADMSTISRDMSAFPLGDKTVVGERGVTLSGGQKQRIALSRALAIDPTIVILDDTFSAVDTETEDSILSHLIDDIRGRTTLIISHRISTLKYADQIVVLENGRITQQGTHEELAAAEGFYREIYTIQRLEDELEERV
jgi:ATP-binding cassette subfamily B protein